MQKNFLVNTRAFGEKISQLEAENAERQRDFDDHVSELTASLKGM